MFNIVDKEKLEPETRLRIESLSNRETEIFFYLFTQWKNQEIADKLFISEKTVRFHLSGVYRKLGLKNRLDVLREFGPEILPFLQKEPEPETTLPIGI